LWHMRVPFVEKTQGNFPGRRSAPNPPPGRKGSNSSKAKARLPVKPDKYLAKLEAEYRAEELKARIKATKMMLQGLTYSQVVEGPVVPPHVPANIAPRTRPALTPDGAIAILEDAIGRLQIPPQQ
jgi:hypothetical protein